MIAGFADAATWIPGDAHTIDLWAVELQVTPEDWTLLTPGEVAAARRIVVPPKRDQKAVARAALRRILSRYVGEPPERIAFAIGEHGKPRLAHHAAIDFNLSHSERLGLVAVAHGVRVGVDVEHARDGRAFEAIAERFFSPAEAARFAAVPAAGRCEAFYRAWTRKEAYLKAWGTGLSFPSDAFTIDFLGEGGLLASDMPRERLDQWRFVDVAVGPAYVAALCHEGPPRPLRFWSTRPAH